MFRAGIAAALNDIDLSRYHQAMAEESRQRQQRLAAEEARLREAWQHQMDVFNEGKAATSYANSALDEWRKLGDIARLQSPPAGPGPQVPEPGQASVPMIQPGEAPAGMPPGMMPPGALPAGAQGPPAALSPNWMPSDAASPELGGAPQLPPPGSAPRWEGTSGGPSLQDMALIRAQAGGEDVSAIAPPPGLPTGTPLVSEPPGTPKSPEDALAQTQLPGAPSPGKLPPQWLSIPNALAAMEKANVPVNMRLQTMQKMYPLIMQQNKEAMQDFQVGMKVAEEVRKFQETRIKQLLQEQGRPGATERLITAATGAGPGAELASDVVKRQGTLTAGQRGPAAAAAATDLTPDAIDIAAAQYLKSGQLPQMWRDPESKKIILNRAGEMQRESGTPATDVPGERATFKADTGSLAQITRRTDALEQSAKKIDKDITTLDKFLESGTAGSVTLINKPLNTIRTAFSDPELSKLALAAKIVGTEYERMINGGLLSIAQLHEGAREDARKLLNEDMTPKQMREIVNVMRQEIDNQRNAFKEQSTEIKGRLKGGVSGYGSAETAPSGGGAAAPKGLPAGSKKIGQTPDGKPVWQSPDGKKWVE